LRRLVGTQRAAGAWGIAFVVLLLVSAAMVSLPTAAETGVRIAAFYAAHRQLIVLQQDLGVVALAAFIAFGLSLPPNRWLRLALWAFVVTELATNLVPLVIVATNPSPETAHSWTFVEDLADAALFISVALLRGGRRLRDPGGGKSVRDHLSRSDRPAHIRGVRAPAQHQAPGQTCTRYCRAEPLTRSGACLNACECTLHLGAEHAGAGNRESDADEAAFPALAVAHDGHLDRCTST
jgi:hypothetical protein